MKSKIQAVRGTQDFFGEKIDKFNYIVDIAKKNANLYNFKEIQVPIFENSNLFERNLGDTSDVVMKEVYKFQDKGGDMISLRPEFTAGVVRSFLDNGELNQNLPQKFFSYGPVFRYDRPQKGRYRQFHQINYEYFGYGQYYEDVEMLMLAYRIIKNLNINDVSLEINSLGSNECKNKYTDALKKYFEKYKNDLSEDSKIRLQKNPLRILDSKNENDKKLLNDVPLISEFYSYEEKLFLNNVIKSLENFNINYTLNTNLVRGLDYYTSIVFEFTTKNLGAQATILGGGRYDKLIEDLSGTLVPASGFGGGIERMMLLLNNEIKKKDFIVLLPITDNEIEYSFNLLNKLRNKGYNVEFLYKGKFKTRLEKINKINATQMIVIGEEEVKTNKIKIKDLYTKKESDFKI